MIVALWRLALFGFVCCLGWVGWALWWPIEPPIIFHASHAEPRQVRVGQTVAMISDAEFRRDVIVHVTPRIDAPGRGVFFLPATEQLWRAGRYQVRRIVTVPALAPGEWRYTPTFSFALTPLRDGYFQGIPIDFEVLP